MIAPSRVNMPIIVSGENWAHSQNKDEAATAKPSPANREALARSGFPAP